ncbi:MAG: FAD-binding protein [Planctomycetes bacterium]|nr:FAD-binding protein [Planctomycetota bacterium]
MTRLNVLSEDGVRTDASMLALTEIASTIEGEVRTDPLVRALYSTDASIYEITPDGVVFPKSVDDVRAVVRICETHLVPVTPRGAGTGLAGGAVNRGVQLDCSRHLDQILEIDAANRTVRVEPGVVLDDLNAALEQHGLLFAPDVATASRANIGGMIANNSCGSHSVIYGRTCDHLVAVDVVLSDGSLARWGADTETLENPLANECERVLAEVLDEEAEEIEARIPKILRQNAGYALDRLKKTKSRVNAETIICGSEGTLGVIVGATLKLVEAPKHKGLVVAHFHDVLASLVATPIALEHKPAAVELIDKLILDATEKNPAMAKRRGFIKGEPGAVLICELYDDDERRLEERLVVLAEDLESRTDGYAFPVIRDHQAQGDVWAVRTSGLGLLMSKPGDEQAYAFVEDTAVDPSKLHDYIEQFAKILKEEGVKQAGYYAHASVGCLHVRPVLNLKKDEDIQRMHRVADRISSLALAFGGAMTGEHGDGILRSCWLEKMVGPRLRAAMKRIKQTFDPDGILNPGKIIDPLRMTENLRYGASFESKDFKTAFDFSTHGGMAGLAGMCSGVGQCRQSLVGTMCPSYMATQDELHTTRARANALRIALSNRSLLDGLSDPALDEVFDLCLSCKACKTECPTGTDVAKLKTEWLSARNRRMGVSRRSRLVADAVGLAKWGSRFAPLSNWFMRSAPVRRILDKRYGLDRRIPAPRYARRTFHQWFERRNRAEPSAPNSDQKRIVLFVDTWTNHHTPQVGIAAVAVLEAMGFRVLCPQGACCGRPLISQGMLAEAKLLAKQNVEAFAAYAHRDIPIVGLEPSCVSVFTDELPQLVRTNGARRLAASVMMLESFVARQLEEDPSRLRVRQGRVGAIRYHSHCHQKALYGTGDAMELLARVSDDAAEINSGCCGMAGSFGHEVEHYDVAKAVGEQRLFPAVRDRGDASIAISGFSCRSQIEHHTKVRAKHVIEYVADALDPDGANL